MRCDACGAANPASAAWCNQCLRSLVDAPTREPSPTPARTAPPASAREASAAGVRARHAPAAAADAALRPAVRRRDDGAVEWQCPTCGRASGLDDSACRACGTSLAAGFAAAGGRDATPGRPPVAPGVGLALSAVLPGAGHLASGRLGSGFARALLYAVWLPGGAALAVAPGAGSLAVAVPLLLGALVLWAASLADVVALHAGGRQLADGRALLWLVVAVLALTLIGATAAVGSALS